MRAMIAVGMLLVTVAGCQPANAPSAECRRQNAWRRLGRSSQPDRRLDELEDIRCDGLERDERREAREDAHRAEDKRERQQARRESAPAPRSVSAPVPENSDPAGAETNLSGLWLGEYGPERFETIRIEQDGPSIVATKVTGDTNVPAGKPTFRATMIGTEGDGAVHIADEGYQNPRWVSGHVSIVSKDVIEFRRSVGRAVRLRRVTVPAGAQ